MKVSQLREVKVEELLDRAPVEVNTEKIRQTLSNRVVLVTGAAGSVGSELCRQIARYNPRRLLLVDHSVEVSGIEQELMESGYGGVVLPVVAKIGDLERMRYLFQRFEPEIIFHGAAHKHVALMEGQPNEAILNNALGTARLAEVALEYGVERFVLISTDDAMNPTSVMGATKRLAEIFSQSLQASLGDPEGRAGVSPAQSARYTIEREGRRDACPTFGKTKFMAVRFGNVLGSSGSVLAIFKKQIAAGGPVKVTHPDVTRCFLTVGEAAGLILESAAQGIGGEIFVVDMGKLVKIVELARELIEPRGLKAGEDIEIVFTGLRPGEKLSGEVAYEGRNLVPTDHPKIMRFLCEPEPLEDVRRYLEVLESHLYDAEADQLKLMLKKAVPEYQPYLT